MTFKTTEKNEFKKDYLKGLEYSHDDYKPFPFVQVFLYMLVILAIATAVYTCNTKAEPVTVEQLNTGRI